MALLLNICPVEINLCATRGDTSPWTFTIKSAGSAVNITGFSYLLTVDPDVDPTGSGNNLFQLTGAITDAANGIVQFGLTVGQADQTPAIYHYDLQQTDGSSKLRTIAKGIFEFKQDITK